MTTDNNKFNYTTTDKNKFNYMMLSRLQQDCNYFLGYGNRNEKQLWAGNIPDHINEMKKIHNSFTADEKPDWLSYDEILELERKMKG